MADGRAGRSGGGTGGGASAARGPGGGKGDAAANKTGRLAAIRENYRLTKRSDPRIGWILLAVFLGTLLVVGGLLWWLLNPYTGVLLGLPAALLATTYLFSRRAMRSAYGQLEGQAGAAAAVAQSLRGNWSTTPAVSVTRNQDLVHRLVGRCGVVLLSEGPPTRVRGLLAAERKRTARFVPDVPIAEVQMGDEEGQVPLTKLQRHLTKLPSTLRPAEVTEIRRRLDALTQNPLPVPKGPIPKSTRAIPRNPKG